ncbi:ABC transporter ATP-binding protein [Paenibacillus alba]|uniref:ABC transporter ATP-binding protein n=1 Tax=Paenibacillus alba TaxID=1197127 RepID=A0ABU6FYH6_9BACL|nr:ABC transporter ATP-binding protein [Paenibacillus alba]MEC0226785.1 ABC transporter ATP-binding protein [Paenibacillus alba]NQX68434.1 ABC transporter ATP-binding protein [Paenibacillus alba]
MSIQIANVSKKFGSFQALKLLNLSIAEGEFVAILGPSGCGKTTLLRMLAGFEQPTTGEIQMNHTTVAKPGFSLPPEKRRIGMVFQAFALWPHLNVTEHVRFPIRHHKETPASIKSREQDRITEVLQMVGLSQHALRMPHELSGGQKQRVALARAIASEPSLLLMDEPLSSLDAMLRMDMRREIQSIHRQTGTAVVYVTHDQGEALAMADRIVVMKDGQIEQIGTPQDIYLRPQTEFVAKFVSKANLVRGRWHNDMFAPISSDGTVQWHGSQVADYFRATGLYPVRPDQFQLSPPHQSGIQGEVVNVQFQGKEFHYDIRSEDGQWEISSPLHFQLHDKVSLNLLNEPVQNYNNIEVFA